MNERYTPASLSYSGSNVWGLFIAAGNGLMSRSSTPADYPIGELIRICASSSDPGAWEELVRRLNPVITATVRRTARRFGDSSDALLADLIQETYRKICSNRCRVLRDFKGENPDAIFGVVKKTAFSVAFDFCRSQRAGRRGGGKGESPLDTYIENTVASSDGLSGTERTILIHEIEELVAGESRRDRWIFWLKYRHGMTARAIAAIPGVALEQKGVESTIHRLTSRVRESLVKRAPTGTKENPGNVRSIGRATE